MDRTLFTPAMIETFRVCKRAYELAFIQNLGNIKKSPSNICKKFLLKALAEVHKGKISTINEAQRFIGQHWNYLKLDNNAPEELHNRNIQAFRFAYRALTSYVTHPYIQAGSEIVAINTRIRARVPHSGVYIEDTFDLILWHPQEQVLEIVDFHLNPLKPFDLSWPTPAILIKQFLCEKLRSRLPFKHIKLTFIQIQSSGQIIHSFNLDDSIMRIHWPLLVNTLDEMKSSNEFPPHRSEVCKRCKLLGPCLKMGGFASTSEMHSDVVYRSA